MGHIKFCSMAENIHWEKLSPNALEFSCVSVSPDNLVENTDIQTSPQTQSQKLNIVAWCCQLGGIRAENPMIIDRFLQIGAAN